MPTSPLPLLTRSRRTLALAGAGALVALAASPGAAAAPVAQADATALVLTVLSTPADSGTVKATHDGADETVVGQQNGFSDIFQGAVVPKGSPLGPILIDAIKVLMADGSYAAIMKKWGLENNMIKEPGLNLGGQLPK